MIFESLHESAKNNELILVDGGFCRFHIRKDGQLTIREILVLPRHQYKGVATFMLETLKDIANIKACNSIFAKCPEKLIRANKWYLNRGFVFEGYEQTKTGRSIMLWRLNQS